MNEKIIKICNQKFIYMNYSPRTASTYIYYIKEFFKSVGDKQIAHCNSTDFQSFLDKFNFTSVSQQNQVINAIKFLYEMVLEKKYDKVSFTRPRSEKKLPQVIDKDLILSKIDKITNLKHKAILSLSVWN